MCSRCWQRVGRRCVGFACCCKAVRNTKCQTFLFPLPMSVSSDQGWSYRRCLYFKEKTASDYDALFLCIKHSSVQKENCSAGALAGIHAGSGKATAWKLQGLKQKPFMKADVQKLCFCSSEFTIGLFEDGCNRKYNYGKVIWRVLIYIFRGMS